MVPTNDTVACDMDASRSQRKDMTVDFVRPVLLSEAALVDLYPKRPSSSSENRFPLHEEEDVVLGQGDPLV
jgi:hypothetical protein